MKSISKGIKALIVFILLAGVVLAVLPLFDWDIFKFGEWAIDKVIYAIERVAEYLLGRETFVKIFKS